jgi:hypothetical protein
VLAALDVAFESSTRIWPRGCALMGCQLTPERRPNRRLSPTSALDAEESCRFHEPASSTPRYRRAVVSVRATEMGVLEVIRILESEGEQSVHADVPEPYQA